jgi:hypothetical protein
MYIYTTYTRPLSVQAQYSRSYPIGSTCYNSSLVTWTVVCLTAAKFKPLVFPVSRFALSNVANICIFMILYDFYSVLLNRTRFYNHFALTVQKTQPFHCWQGVFTAPLHNNEDYSIAACVFVAAGMCLPSRCLAMNVYSDFTVPTFKCYVTIFLKLALKIQDERLWIGFIWPRIGTSGWLFLFTLSTS